MVDIETDRQRQRVDFHQTQQTTWVWLSSAVQLNSCFILKVVARDEESGEEVSASVDIEVLQRGQAGETTSPLCLPLSRKHSAVACKLGSAPGF